jgi:cell division protein ZapA
MAERNRIEVEILGQKYAIRSEADPRYVRELAAFVDQRAREIRGDSPAQDLAKILALTALYVADEFFRLRDERSVASQDSKEVVARLGAMRQLLDSVVPES